MNKLKFYKLNVSSFIFFIQEIKILILKLRSFLASNTDIIIIWLVSVIVTNSIPFLISLITSKTGIFNSFINNIVLLWIYYWDGSYYISISEFGYKYPYFAFFPGYPLFLNFLKIFLPSFFVYRVNIFLLFFLLIQVKKLLQKMNFNNSQVTRGIIGFLCFPTSFFLQANYTETLYILISAWGLNLILERKYLVAGVIGSVLSFVKITSVGFSFVYLLSLILEYKSKILSLNKVKYLFMFLLTFFGIFSYLFYLHYQFNDITLFFKSQREWGRISTDENPRMYNTGTSTAEPYYLYEGLVFIFGIFVIIYSYKKINIYLYTFSVIHFLIPILTGTLLSINRLFLYSFPLILWFFAYISRYKELYRYVLIFMFTLQFIAIYMFKKGFFVG